jgi:hypothetical protein
MLAANRHVDVNSNGFFILKSSNDLFGNIIRKIPVSCAGGACGFLPHGRADKLESG